MRKYGLASISKTFWLRDGKTLYAIRQYHSTCVFLMLNYKFLLHVSWMHNMTCIYNHAFLSPGILNFSYSSSCAKRISELKYFHQNFYITFEVWMVFDVVCIYKFPSAIWLYIFVQYIWIYYMFELTN